VLLHFGRVRLIWDWTILLLVAYLSIMLPFNVAFKAHHNLRPFFIADFFGIHFHYRYPAQFPDYLHKPENGSPGGQTKEDRQELPQALVRFGFDSDNAIRYLIL